MLQGAGVGGLGSVLGIALAGGMIWLFTRVVRGADGLPLFDISLSSTLAVQVAAMATICSVLAAIAPARRAAAMEPT